MFNNFFPENGAVYETGTAREATGDNIIRRMRFACWITRVYRHTHSEYVILIAFPQPQRLREKSLGVMFIRKLRGLL